MSSSFFSSGVSVGVAGALSNMFIRFPIAAFGVSNKLGAGSGFASGCSFV